MNRRTFAAYCATAVAALCPWLKKRPTIPPVTYVLPVRPAALYFPLQTVPHHLVIGEAHAETILRVCDGDEERLALATDRVYVYPLDGSPLPFVEWRHLRTMRLLLGGDPRGRAEFIDAYTKPIRTSYVDYDVSDILKVQPMPKRRKS